MIKKPNKILQQLFLRLDERAGFSADRENISKFGHFDINFEKEKYSFCFSKKVGPMKVVNKFNSGES